MSATFEIRPARVEDGRGIAATEVASWRSAYAALMPADFLAAMDEAAQAQVWRGDVEKHAMFRRKRLAVGVVGGEVAGFIRVGPPSEAEPVGMIYLIYVRPEQWSTGLGAALMTWGLDQLREMGMREAILWVLEDNKRARAFYEAGGWRADGQTNMEDFGGAVLRSVCYRLPLAG